MVKTPGSNAELVWIEGAGHMVPWHHSEVVIEAVQRTAEHVTNRARGDATADDGRHAG